MGSYDMSGVISRLIGVVVIVALPITPLLTTQKNLQVGC